jgi:hypothetical protein
VDGVVQLLSQVERRQVLQKITCLQVPTLAVIGSGAARHLPVALNELAAGLKVIV